MIKENSETPYENLNPDMILAAMESIGLDCNGSMIALNSYENRVYQMGMNDADPVIVKFYRPKRWSDAAILEEHQFAAELLGQEIPVVAPFVIHDKTLHHFNEFRFAVFKRQGGRALELDNLQQLEWMGRFIGRLHAVGSCRPFQHRHVLSLDYFGFSSFHFLIENNFIPDYLKQKFSNTVTTLLNKIETIFQQAGEIRRIRLHGDCHPGNVLWRDSGPHIVDLDDCMMGPAIQDVWMLLSGNKMEMEMQLDKILRGYNEFHDFNYRELHLIESLRTLRMLYYSAWLARRWQDPAFPMNFPWFNTAHYWQEQLNNLSDQVYLLDEEE